VREAHTFIQGPLGAWLGPLALYHACCQHT
jgi:hypothetical protein